MANLVTIYDVDGNAVHETSLNAYDMVRLGKYFYSRKEALLRKSGDIEDEPEVTQKESAKNEQLSLFHDPLHLVAEEVLGPGADVATYLDSITKERLLQLADLRYGLRMKLSDSKAKVIAAIIERENSPQNDEVEE